MAITRRVFLKSGALALVGFGVPMAGPSFLRRAVFAAEPERAEGGRKVLVCLFLRGAVDGLNLLVPHGDADYVRLRPGLAIPAKGAQGQAALDLDGFYGFHPALEPLKRLYDDGRLAAVAACGSPDATRSHFDAQDYMETAAPGDRSVATGWLARTLAACPEDRPRTPLRAVALTDAMPLSLSGSSEALAVASLGSFRVGGSGPAGDAGKSFEAVYEAAQGDPLRTAGRDAFEAIRTLERLDAGGYRPAGGARYPAGRLGTSMRQIAQLIKADVGLEVAFAESGGWDTHVNQGAATGQMANRLRELGEAMAAFHADLGRRMDDVVLLTMSEFGRTARENGSRGTDHGHATCFLALGGPVRGGKVYGDWPGLAEDRLHEGRDLALTTDFRDVFAEVADRHLGAKTLKTVFPGHSVSSGRYRGLLKA